MVAGACRSWRRRIISSTSSGSGSLKGEGGLDGKSSHVGGRDLVAELGEGEEEIDLRRVKLVVGTEGGNILVKVQGVGIAEEE